jgi:hypothetical protein
MKKSSFRRNFLHVTLAAMLLALSLPANVSAQAVTSTTNQFVPFAQIVAVPCANGGAGELILVSGILHIQNHITINGNRVNLKSHFQPQGASAIGLSTGDIYRAVGVTQSHDTIPLTNGAATTTSINNFRMIGPGPNNNFQVHQNIHTTINANGDVTSTVVNTSTDCN